MMIQTTDNCEIDAKFISSYFNSLINCFFKILPMSENKEETLCAYMRGLKTELLGCRGLVLRLQYDSLYVTLMATLQSLMDGYGTEDIADIKRDVFKSISICKLLSKKYAGVVNNVDE